MLGTGSRRARRPLQARSDTLSRRIIEFLHPGGGKVARLLSATRGPDSDSPRINVSGRAEGPSLAPTGGFNRRGKTSPHLLDAVLGHMFTAPAMFGIASVLAFSI